MPFLMLKCALFIEANVPVKIIVLFCFLNAFTDAHLHTLVTQSKHYFISEGDLPIY